MSRQHPLPVAIAAIAVHSDVCMYVRTCMCVVQGLRTFLCTHVFSPYSLTLTPPPLHRRNEEMDDKVLIKRLKKRVAELEAEVEQLRQELGSPPQQV